MHRKSLLHEVFDFLLVLNYYTAKYIIMSINIKWCLNYVLVCGVLFTTP